MANNKEERLREAFNLFDTNGDGRVSNFTYTFHFVLKNYTRLIRTMDLSEYNLV